MCIVHAIVNQKGGVGKTTSAVNLADVLSSPPHNKRVLLVDMDPQGHASLHVDMRDQSRRPPIYRLLVEETPLRELVQKTKYNFDLVAGGAGNASSENTLAGDDGGIEALAKGLSGVADDYDVVLIDCPPSLGQLLLCALGAADDVLVPMPLQAWPADGLELLLKKVVKTRDAVNPKLRVGAIFATNSNTRTRLAQFIRGELEEEVGDVFLSSAIRINTQLAEAQKMRVTVTEYAPDSPGLADYRALAAELAERGLV